MHQDYQLALGIFALAGFTDLVSSLLLSLRSRFAQKGLLVGRIHRTQIQPQDSRR